MFANQAAEKQMHYEELRRGATLLLKARRSERSAPRELDRLRSEAIRLLFPWRGAPASRARIREKGF